MSDQSPYKLAREKVKEIKEQLAKAALGYTTLGTIADGLRMLFEAEAINIAQHQELLFGEPARTNFEITLLTELLKAGHSCKDDSELFIWVQQQGAKYYFENHSPLAGFFKPEEPIH